jgi:hypothetical protein
MRRHSLLSIKKPQPVSAAKAEGITPEYILNFFDICEPLLEMSVFSPSLQLSRHLRIDGAA